MEKATIRDINKALKEVELEHCLEEERKLELHCPFGHLRLKRGRDRRNKRRDRLELSIRYTAKLTLQNTRLLAYNRDGELVSSAKVRSSRRRKKEYFAVVRNLPADARLTFVLSNSRQ